MSRDKIQKQINSIKNSRQKTSQLRMKTISNIKTRYKGMNLKKKNLINNSRYITIKRMRTEFDIKINCEGMKLKKN